METYQEFLDRINSFEKKEITFDNKYFKGNPSIKHKVDANNTFKNFYGDTIVFALSDIVKKKLTEYVDLLYQSAPECFCERLASNTFHVTLHDLSNSPVLQNVAGELFENELRVIEKKREIQQAAKTTLKLKSNYIFNMVDTSLVLGLYSADKDEYCQLMRLYSIFDDVKKLDYPFTPHITLAYYNVNGFRSEAARNLEKIPLRNQNKTIFTPLYQNRLLSVQMYKKQQLLLRFFFPHSFSLIFLFVSFLYSV